jgi:hypothetical protein
MKYAKRSINLKRLVSLSAIFILAGIFLTGSALAQTDTHSQGGGIGTWTAYSTAGYQWNYAYVDVLGIPVFIPAPFPMCDVESKSRFQGQPQAIDSIGVLGQCWVNDQQQYYSGQITHSSASDAVSGWVSSSWAFSGTVLATGSHNFQVSIGEFKQSWSPSSSVTCQYVFTP